MACPTCGREYESHLTFCVDCQEPLVLHEAPPEGPVTGGRIPRDLFTRDPQRERQRRHRGDLRSSIRYVLGDVAGGLPPEVDPGGDRDEPDMDLGGATSLLATFRTGDEAKQLSRALGEAGIRVTVIEEQFEDIPPDLAIDLEPHRVYVFPEDWVAAMGVAERAGVLRPDPCPACGARLAKSTWTCPACGAKLT
jgi:hypothetical protein